jgi:cytochrome c oxidase assembly protein subunit 11
MSAIAVFIFGLSYASVPLYKVFCQMTGYGGTTQRADENKIVEPVKGAKVIKVDFVANTHSTMPWTFKPTQTEVKIVPGETALAFYTVNNPTDKAILGVATYNVFPPKAGLYFNKIQCFCFEEQRLGPHEEVDMPVFFFIDPEICNDPAMESTTSITLSYTFFKTGEEEIEKDGEKTIVNRDAKTEAYAKALIERNKQNTISTDNNIDDSNDNENNQNIISSYITYILSYFKLN